MFTMMHCGMPSHQFLERLGKGEAVSHCAHDALYTTQSVCIRYLPSALISCNTSLQMNTQYSKHGPCYIGLMYCVQQK